MAGRTAPGTTEAQRVRTVIAHFGSGQDAKGNKGQKGVVPGSVLTNVQTQADFTQALY